MSWGRNKVEVNPLTVVAILGMASLLIERVFYYRSRYSKKKKDCKPENPNHGERLATLEEAVETIKERLDKIERKLP